MPAARPAHTMSLAVRSMTAAALLATLGACSSSTTAGGGGGMSGMPNPEASRAGSVSRSATLSPYGTNRIGGTVSLTSDDDANGGATSVRLQLTGAPQNALMRWHVHTGACGSNGPVFGNAAGYGTLSSSDIGAVQTAIRLRMALPATDALSVDVHDEGGSTVVIACGDLRPAR